MVKFSQFRYGNSALTFDDVLLKPQHSEVIPKEVLLQTNISKNISLNLPILSAAMDTVTKSSMAIAMAQAGGLGIIHKNMSIKEQCEEVRLVKRFVSGMVLNPLIIEPDATLRDAKKLMKDHQISGIPVVENSNHKNKLVGILTNRDVRFAKNLEQPVRELMTCNNLITVRENIHHDEAKKILHKNRIEKLLVINKEGSCVGLITVKDIEKSQLNPFATKDEKGRLRVGAASTVFDAGYERSQALIDCEVDVIVIDTAHGHSSHVLKAVERIKKNYSNISVIAGNVATKEATKALIDHGADSIKIGVGPGSICTTRIVAGVGIPQLSAILECYEEAEKFNIPVIADGGIKFSGDLAKAMAAGASAVMLGSLLAGTDESPGEIHFYQGQAFCSYRGMGSLAAMKEGSSDRYFQSDVENDLKFVPEGVEGRIAYKGSVNDVLYQLSGGLRVSMGYLGAKTLKSFRENAEFVQITNAGLKESHAHNVFITRENLNYPLEKL